MVRVIVKKGNIGYIDTEKENIMECKPLPDGLCFTLKGGLYVTYTDQFMQPFTKETIVQMMRTNSNVSLTVDLANYTTPVKIEMN